MCLALDDWEIDPIKSVSLSITKGCQTRVCAYIYNMVINWLS